MNKYLIKQATVINENERFVADVLIENDVIAQIDSRIDNRKIEFGWVEHKRCVDKKVIPLETQLKYFSWVDINFEDLYKMRETYKLHNYIFPEDDFQILLQMICKTENSSNVVYPGE